MRMWAAAVFRWARANLKVLLWTVLAIAAAIFTAWMALKKKSAATADDKPKPGSADDATGAEGKSFQDVAREQIDAAQTEAHIEAEIAKADSDAKRAQLATIKADPDPDQRRQKLADYLDANL